MKSSETVTAATLKQFLEAFNRHDLDPIMEFFANDRCVDTPRGPDSWGTRLIGKLQVRAGCANRFAGLPDAHCGEDRHWVSRNMGFSEWTLTGTTPSGEYGRERGTDHLEFPGGRIVRKDSYCKIIQP
jgi:ketosteroid isomerase-like protein